MKLTVIGCSPAWPNPGGAHSGYLLEGPGSLLVDCGPGVLSRLRGPGGWPDVDAIAISHFHLDHYGDLVPWIWGTLHLREADAPRPELWLPRGVRATLGELGSPLGSAETVERVFDLREYEAGVPFSAAGFSVTPRRLPHYSIESHGLRITDGRSTLAYSADSGPSPDLAELARDADLFLCEATLPAGEEDGDPRGHLSLDEARAAFAAAGARRLVVVHRPAELPSEGAELAYDGMTVEL